MDYCLYYQARVEPSVTWFFTGALRSFEHLCFDRTLDAKSGIFEFFVPVGQELFFIQVMDYFVDQSIVSNVQKLPNRLLDPGQTV